MAKSGSSLVHSHKSHVLCLTLYVKARKSFHGVLPRLVMMYYQTNLDCKRFSISKDQVETIVAASTLNVAKWYSGWWWCITILSLTDQRYCPGKHSLKFRTFTVTLTTAQQPFHKTVQLINMHRQTKLVAKKICNSEHIIEIITISLYERKFSYCDLDDRNPFFRTWHPGLWCITILGLVTNGSSTHKISPRININWNL